jgi:hypothetical protein
MTRMPPQSAQETKSFLVLFFKKELLAALFTHKRNATIYLHTT